MRKPVYIPKALNPHSFWVAVAEFATLILMWGTILAVAVFARAIMGV
jgi:hypothetical protein